MILDERKISKRDPQARDLDLNWVRVILTITTWVITLNTRVRLILNARSLVRLNVRLILVIWHELLCLRVQLSHACVRAFSTFHAYVDGLPYMKRRAALLPPFLRNPPLLCRSQLPCRPSRSFAARDHVQCSGYGAEISSEREVHENYDYIQGSNFGVYTNYTQQ